MILAHNEVQNIGPTLSSLTGCLRRHAIHHEIVVDGSQDATEKAAREMGTAAFGVRLVRNDGAYGFGRAIRCGLEAFTDYAVVFMMANCSDAPEDVVRYCCILRDESNARSSSSRRMQQRGDRLSEAQTRH